MNVSFLRRFWVTVSALLVGIYAKGFNRLRVVGIEHIPAHGGVLIASNHISPYETVFLPAVLLRRFPLQMLWAPAKEELFKKPLQRFIYSSWGAFPVKRGRDVRAGKVLHDLLMSEKVMLFPEGTRHPDGRLGQGNRGMGKVIYDTRPVVIPTALIGLNHWAFPSFGACATIVFGAPLDLDDLYQGEDCKDTHLKIVERVMDAIESQLKAEGAFVGRLGQREEG